jgi:hypothetical protein
VRVPCICCELLNGGTLLQLLLRTSAEEAACGAFWQQVE